MNKSINKETKDDGNNSPFYEKSNDNLDHNDNNKHNNEHNNKHNNEQSNNCDYDLTNSYEEHVFDDGEMIPFEYHAYEALLTTANSMESQEFNFIDKSVQKVLSFFKSGALLPIEIQEKMRTLKNDLSAMINRIKSSRRVLDFITQDEEEMALMNLGYLKSKPKLYR